MTDEPRLQTELAAAKLRGLPYYCQGVDEAKRASTIGLAGLLADEIEQLDATISPSEFVAKYKIAEEKAREKYRGPRTNRSPDEQEWGNCIEDINRLSFYDQILLRILPLKFLEAVKQEYRNSGDVSWLDFNGLRERFDRLHGRFTQVR